MGKSQNYIITLVGVIFIIGIILFGVVRFYIFHAQEPDIKTQTIDFLFYVIPAMIGTAIAMAKILNLNEKKELKAEIKLSNEYQLEIKSQQEEMKQQSDDVLEIQKEAAKQQSENEKALLRIEENITIYENNEAQRSLDVKLYFEELNAKELKHKEKHKIIDENVKTIQDWIEKHEIHHNGNNPDKQILKENP